MQIPFYISTACLLRLFAELQLSQFIKQNKTSKPPKPRCRQALTMDSSQTPDPAIRSAQVDLCACDFSGTLYMCRYSPTQIWWQDCGPALVREHKCCPLFRDECTGNVWYDPGGSKHWKCAIFEIPEQTYPHSHFNGNPIYGDVDKQSGGKALSVIAFLHQYR